MKKSVLCLAVLAFGCKSNPEQNLKEELKPTIQKYLSEKYSKDKLIIDSVTIYKVDTLTALKDSARTIKMLSKNINDVSEELTKMQNSIGRKLDSVKLDDGKSPKLEEDYKKAYSAYLERKKEAFPILDAKMARMEKIGAQIVSQKIDSLAMTGYIIDLRAKAHDANKANRNLDSIKLYFNKDKQIIKRKV
jgi:DNA repair ATPase RecN